MVMVLHGGSLGKRVEPGRDNWGYSAATPPGRQCCGGRAGGGWRGQLAEGLVATGVVRGRGAGADVNGVVQAAEQAVFAEVEDLLGGIGGDDSREGGVRPAPGWLSSSRGLISRPRTPG
jgi:hypothetical protein